MPCSDHSVSLDWCRDCTENDQAAEAYAAKVKDHRSDLADLLDYVNDESNYPLDGDVIVRRLNAIIKSCP